MTRTAADAIAAVLIERGVRFVPTVPGGMIGPLLDALHRHGVRLITVGHEQAASFAAEAAARLTGQPAVALATVGPGALNLVTGLASAWLDSIPAVFLVGHVQSYLQRGDRPLRQRTFQEIDFAEVAAPICKAVWKVARAAEAGPVVRAAFELAAAGRPGPVVVQVPFDVQAGAAAEDGPAPPPIHRRADSPEPPPPDDAAARVADHLASATRPLIIAGGGVRMAGAVDAVVALADRIDAPIATTLHALDLVPHDHPRHAGMIGPYGHRRTNLLLLESDLVLALGTRLDHGHTGADTGGFRRGRRVVHVDRDAGELTRTTGIDGVHAELGALLAALAPQVQPRDHPAWRARLAALRAQHPVEAELAGAAGIDPHAAIAALVDRFPAPGAIVVDLGQHTWWTAQAARLRAGHRFIAATGLGCMGYALGAAIGLALSGLPTLAIVGDGAAQMTIQELETLRRNALDVLVVVLDNQTHGMVREYQAEAFDGRTPASLWGYSAPDFARVADAYRVPARTVLTTADLADAATWAITTAGPRLLHIAIASDTPVRPSVPYGHPLSRMTPPLR